MTQATFPARWWHPLEDGRIQCDLCPRDCRLHEGQAGHCFVRRREGHQLLLSTYGYSSGFAIDPIEKKPLHHFLPGSRVLSFGTAGCNLACRFCQNWDISKSRNQERSSIPGSPQAIAQMARQRSCASVAFTYNDPVIFAEYAIDVAKACHEQGLKTVAVTAGYIHEEPRRDFFKHMDAANVDLKAFSEDFYFKLTGAHLTPVLDTLRYIKQETSTWLEITTLLIPGQNDSQEELEGECLWILEHLGPHVPLHFTAFHPDYKMTDLPRTPLSTLQRAKKLAHEIGLNYVYLGNVRDEEGAQTRCPKCRQILVQRSWHEVLEYSLSPAGQCPSCQHPIPGVFAKGS